MDTCIFCKIIEHEQPAKIVYEDDHVVAIEDIRPQAPVHLLVMPRKHVATLQDSENGDEAMMGHLFAVVTQLARERQLETRGYRTVINNGPWAGQTVYHLHVHVLGGRVFHWPPG